MIQVVSQVVDLADVAVAKLTSLARTACPHSAGSVFSPFCTVLERGPSRGVPS